VEFRSSRGQLGLEACYAQVERLLKAEEASGYQVEALLEAAKE
jgi:hypothetical protein